MGCCVGDVAGWLDESFPLEMAASWDCVGLVIGDEEALVEHVVVALDPSVQSLKAAQMRGASLLVTHHPPWVRPLVRVCRQQPEGELVWKAVRWGVSIYCAHTNLDCSTRGPSAQLAEYLGLCDVEEMAEGLGRVGRLQQPLLWNEFRAWLQERFPHTSIRGAGRTQEPIERVAVCGGSGASVISDASRIGAQVLVTGDVKYHDARKAESLGLLVLDVGHFSSERPVVSWLARQIDRESCRRGWGLRVSTFEEERDPLRPMELLMRD